MAAGGARCQSPAFSRKSWRSLRRVCRCCRGHFGGYHLENCLSSMKTRLLLLFAIVAHTALYAQDYAYQSVTLKTNVINLFNIGVEFPVYKRFTIDMSCRGYPGLGSYIPQMASQRMNLHYHIPVKSRGLNIPSVFLSAGFNWYSSYMAYFPNERNERAVESYSVQRASFALGIRSRALSIWVAYEPLVQTFKNEYKLYPRPDISGAPISQGTLPDRIPFAASIAVAIVNLKSKAQAQHLPSGSLTPVCH